MKYYIYIFIENCAYFFTLVHSGHGIAGQPTVINFSLLSKACEEKGIQQTMRLENSKNNNQRAQGACSGYHTRLVCRGTWVQIPLRANFLSNIYSLKKL